MATSKYKKNMNPATCAGAINIASAGTRPVLAMVFAKTTDIELLRILKDRYTRKQWFDEPDVHAISNTWPNTSCGWNIDKPEKLFTDYWTVALEFKVLKVVVVFVNNRPAYACKANDAFRDCLKAGKLPARCEVEASPLTLLYLEPELKAILAKKVLQPA